MTPTKTKNPSPRSLSATSEEVEASVYEGLQKGDLNLVMACWAEQHAVSCIHPGGPRLIGLGDIRDSFESLFSDGGGIPLRRESVRRVKERESAVHHVMSRLYAVGSDGACEAYVLATNVYFKTPQGWRLITHHASPGTLAPAQSKAKDVGHLH